MRGLFLLSGLLPFATSSGGEPASGEEIGEYALREALSPGLEAYEGGFHGFLLFLLLVGVVVFLIIEFGHHHEHHHL